MTKKICISCNYEIVSGENSVEFKCPNCKEPIVRCGNCRKSMLKYKCNGCGFEGP